MKVERDDPRYAWPSRRQSKKTRKKNLLREDPLEYAKTFGAESVRQDIQRRTTSAVRRQVSRGTKGALGAAGALGTRAAVAGATAAAVPALAAGAALALAITLGGTLLELAGVRLAAGEKVNAISRRFVSGQQQLMQQARVATWLEVPREARDRLLRDYRSALQRATQGVVAVGRVEGSFK